MAMSTTLDIFNNNAFSASSLSVAIQTGPYKPRMIGEMGLYSEDPIRTTTAWIEKRQGKLALIKTSARGTMGDVRSTLPRSAVPFQIPHYPYHQNILADDVQNVRAFASNELMEVSEHVNDQLEGMKDDHEVTQEFGRVKGIQGIVYDADNTTVIYNFFTQFGLSQTSVNWLTTDVSFVTTTNTVIRTISDKLGSQSFSGIVAFCGDNYFDAVIGHPSVRAAYDRWKFGEFFRTNKLGPQFYKAASYNGFEFQDIYFINYRGQIGDAKFIATNEAYYVPFGIPNLFIEVLAPADMIPFINKKGKRWYASKEFLPHQTGIQLYTQHNILPVPTRPDVVIKSTWAAA